MAKTIYVGVGGVARKVKKAYVGVGGVARKVKKAWVGVGGVARLCFSGGEVSYYGAASALSEARRGLRAASVGNFVLFAGGNLANGLSATVDAYNSALTKSIPSAMSSARQDFASASVGNFALFAGGTDAGSWFLYSVDAYNAALTKLSAAALDSKVKPFLAGASTQNHALFTGGDMTTLMTAYNTALTKTNPANMSVAHRDPKGVSVGGIAIFGSADAVVSGQSTNILQRLDAYDSALTKLTIADFPTQIERRAAATAGGYAIFAGGADHSSRVSTSEVIAFDAALTQLTPTSLNTPRQNMMGVSVGDESAIFSGGLTGTATSSVSSMVEVYDAALARITASSLSVARHQAAAASIGDLALVVGGITASGVVATVDVYTV